MLTVLGTVSITLGRTAVAVTFLTAGLAKVGAGQSRFLSALLGYDLVPKKVAAIIARWLAWAEILVGGLLLVGFMTWMAAPVAVGLLLLFSGTITSSLVRGMDNECGCMGKLAPVQWRLIYRNLFLMGLLLPVYAFSGEGIGVDVWVKQGLKPGNLVAPTGVTILLFVWGLALLATLVIHWFTRAHAFPPELQRSE